MKDEKTVEHRSPVIVLLGGRSEERRVSVASAQTIIAALRQSRPILCWFWARSGEIFELSPEAVLGHLDPYTTEMNIDGARPRFQSIEDAANSPWGTSATWFLCVHGKEGEDGRLQSILERARVRFTGSGYGASTRAFDKAAARELFELSKIPIPQGVVLPEEKDEAYALVAEKLKSWGALVLKPKSEGSSFGLYMITGHSDLDAAFTEISSHDFGAYLLEQRVSGRELTVGVHIHQGELCPLPASEVVLDAGRDFDYEGKYLGLGTTEVTPADISEDTMQKAQDLAMRCHRILGARGYSRTDMILSDEGELVVLELNTLPGLSAASFIPQQLEASGISVLEFVESQLEVPLSAESRSQRSPLSPT